MVRKVGLEPTPLCSQNIGSAKLSYLHVLLLSIIGIGIGIGICTRCFVLCTRYEGRTRNLHLERVAA